MDHRPIDPETTELTGKDMGENLCELTVFFLLVIKSKHSLQKNTLINRTL